MIDVVLQRLELASRSTVDVTQRTLIDCERAYHLARSGDFAGARQIVKSTRQSATYLQTPSISIWVMIVDGIIDFFEDLSPLSQDRFRRAYALSRAIGNADLQGLSSAWLAHTEFERGNHPATLTAIAKCIEVLPGCAAATRARAFMVLANTNLYCANVQEANEFYEATRTVALEQGDRATLGAIVYNRAALMLNSYRLQRIVDVTKAPDLGILAGAVESAAAFQKLTKNRSLDELLLINAARLAMIRSDHAAAVSIIGSVRESSNSHRSGVNKLLLDVEYSLCLAKAGRMREAQDVLSRIPRDSFPDLHADDRVLALSQFIAVQELLLEPSVSADVTELFGAAKAAFSSELEELRASLVQVNGVALAQALTINGARRTAVSDAKLGASS